MCVSPCIQWKTLGQIQKLVLVLVWITRYLVTSGFVKALYFIFRLKENQVMIHKFVSDDRSLFSDFCESL